MNTACLWGNDAVATAVPSSGQTRVRHKEQKSLKSNVPRDKVASSGPTFRVRLCTTVII